MIFDERVQESCSDYRNHWPGRFIFIRVAPGERLYRAWNVGSHFGLSPPQPGDSEAYTLLQRYFLCSQPYYYVVLLSPLVCSGLIFLVSKGYVFLLFFHSWILFGTVTILAKDVSARYLQPMSLLTILILAVLVKAVVDRRSQPVSVAAP